MRVQRIGKNEFHTSLTRHFARHRVEVMVDQAGNFEVQGVKLKGKLTAGENLADLGGLKLGESMRAAERDCTQ